MGTAALSSGNLTAYDRRILRTVNAGASSLSFLGSSFIVLCYLLFRDLRKFSFKLVFYLAISVCSCRDPSTGFFCYAQGYSTHFFCIASFLWTTTIAFTLHRTVVKHKTDVEDMEAMFHLYVWGTSLVMTVIRSMGNDHRHLGGAWCSTPTGRTKKMAEGMSDRASDGRLDMKALNRWGYYPLILIGSWTFGTLNVIHDLIEPGHKIFWLSVLDVGTAALMGLFNSIAYGLNSSVRRAISERLDLILQVLASKSKIYMVLDYVTGGELYDRILENVLLDAKGRIKISDFGLSALPKHFRDDGLLHTICGSPNYVAPEVLRNKGYDGATADVWSCGVILYVTLTGSLPFDDRNLAVLYHKIMKGEVEIPKWMSPGAGNLISRILDPNPATRITMAGIKSDPWFKQDYVATAAATLLLSDDEEYQGELVDDDVDEDDGSYCRLKTQSLPAGLSEAASSSTRPVINAFQLIGMSSCLDLSGFFEEEEVSERKVRFAASDCSFKHLMKKMEEIATAMGFHVRKVTRNQHVRPRLMIMKVVQNQHMMTGSAKSNLSVAAEILEISPSLYVVELQKSYGDSSVYRQLCEKLSNDLGSSSSVTPKSSCSTMALAEA
ncbi:unnamed protein product [Linum tenue]|uniref:non-specific serine/threonine protein kinase n=1 Tax=Linum tenue TaxID=586396 RepID=A0AAV0PBF8_9ROSI|nr:unnamed protein product [Linum tenue]